MRKVALLSFCSFLGWLRTRPVAASAMDCARTLLGGNRVSPANEWFAQSSYDGIRRES